ncbi:MAG: hypothetical protein CM1200mP36_07460 [Gammaproteobacteria bacterium]|nr:MAG: hypothetical protein CM1200mP36_07460 [Gammaproteobacteria bacterium]
MLRRTPGPIFFSPKFHEVQPYFMLSNHGYVGYFVAVNADFWHSLPEDIRSGLEEIMAEVTDWGNERAVAINEDSRQRLLATGRSEIIELPDEELLVWRNAVQPVWDQFSERLVLRSSRRHGAQLQRTSQLGGFLL